MFMNNLNDIKEDTAVPPLKHDYDGRFSRKGAKVEQKVFDPEWLDIWLSALFMAFLLAADFVLVAGSGNIKVFTYSLLPVPSVAVILVGIFALCYGISVGCKERTVRHFAAAVVAFFFIYLIFQQFAQYHKHIEVGNVNIPSFFIFGTVLAAITFVVYEQNKLMFRVLYTVASVVLFFHIYISYTSYPWKQEFVELHNTQKQGGVVTQKYIHFIFPNLVSPAYVASLDGKEARKTQDIMQSFFANNNFKVYNKAYTNYETQKDNLVSLFNFNSKERPENHTLNTRLLNDYWSFYGANTDYVDLKDNALYDKLNADGYKISAYQSRNYDICHKNHQYNVERCVAKMNHPLNIHEAGISFIGKVSILLAEWISSMNLFKDDNAFYSTLSLADKNAKLPFIGSKTNNLYAVEAINALDVLSYNIKLDADKQAYFVFVDTPSNMLIYDEYCQIKPYNQWVNLFERPWVKANYTDERQTAYLQQTRCLFGKMQQFIDRLKNNGDLQNTVIVMQGISGVNNFSAAKINNVENEFLANRMVTMAIYDQNNTDTTADNRLCSSNHILDGYFKGKVVCDHSHLVIHQKFINNINRNLSTFLQKKYIQHINYDEWYEKWRNINHDTDNLENILEIGGETSVEDFGLN